MQSKEKNNKSTCTENNETQVQLPADKVAEIAGVSKSLVKQMRRGKRSADTPNGKKIELTQDLWDSGSNLLLKEIKKIVQL